MTTFTDGPAAGKTLQLLRMPMPYFLRVVRDKGGKIDALDKLDDEPTEGEELFAYKKIEDRGTVHIDGRDKKGKRFGQWFNSCVYALCEMQPGQETMRDKKAWQKWCSEEYAKKASVTA